MVGLLSSSHMSCGSMLLQAQGSLSMARKQTCRRNSFPYPCSLMGVMVLVVLVLGLEVMVMVEKELAHHHPLTIWHCGLRL